MERSTAIKCPNIALHLAGCKKVQQVLAVTGQLEHFLNDHHECELIRNVFAGLYSLDDSEYMEQVEGSPRTKRTRVESVGSLSKVIDKAVHDPSKFVMKPQREGGGNNIYGDAVAKALTTMSPEELKAYILMERIFPPAQSAQLVREGATTEVMIASLSLALLTVSPGRVYMRAGRVRHVPQRSERVSFHRLNEF